MVEEHMIFIACYVIIWRIYAMVALCLSFRVFTEKILSVRIINNFTV